MNIKTKKYLFVVLLAAALVLPEIIYAAIPPRVTTQAEGIDVPEGMELILDVYTVKKTDSLAKIAERKYGDWKKWRLIYEYNDYIKESHWIFPGDTLIVPELVEKLPSVPEIELEEVEEVKIEKPRQYNDFIAPENFSFDGSIVEFRDKKQMYAHHDYCFIDLGRLDGVSEGYKFNIYRPDRRVSHPQTGRVLGTLMKKVGELTVTSDVEDRSSTALITMSHTLIEKNDLLLLAE